MSTVSSPADRYAALVRALRAEADPPAQGASKGKFGDSALKRGGKIFAMLSRDRLVVKLTRERVDALVASGKGARFDPGHGRVMKEWVVVHSSDSRTWLKLAREALAVASRRA